MGTRSDIIVERTDGTWARIYCHWAGYPKHHGRILAAHYNSQKLAETVVKLGDMSSLAEKAGKPKGHSFDKPVKGYCVYYGRDRGDTETEPTIGDSLSAVWPNSDTGTDFTYVWKKDSGWWVGDPDEGLETLVKAATS